MTLRVGRLLVMIYWYPRRRGNVQEARDRNLSLRDEFLRRSRLNTPLG
jgi:hypothetical protein